MSDEPEVWVDYDYPPRPRVYEKCKMCGNDLALTHHCVIATVEQLGELPQGSIVMHDARPFRRRFMEVWQEWGGYDYEIADVPLPARVVWRPGHPS